MTTKATIPANVTTHSWSPNVNWAAIPDLLTLSARYTHVKINQLGVRLIPGYSNANGEHAVGIFATGTITAPGTVTIQWLQDNKSKSAPANKQVSGSPSSPAIKGPVATAQGGGTNHGTIYYAFDGPSEATARTHFATVEVYIDAEFSGRRG